MLGAFLISKMALEAHVKRNNIFIFLVIFVAAGCASVPPQYKDSPRGYRLNQKASRVQVVDFLPSASRDKYDEVDMISCAVGFNGESVENNLRACNNRFKNEAFRRGSNLVLVKPENKRVGVDNVNSLDGTQLSCVNCVDIKGIILKPKVR